VVADQLHAGQLRPIGLGHPDDGGPDHFVHYSEIAGEGHGSLGDGSKVSFEPAEGPKGPVATQVAEQAA
jgi:cold shock protein